MNLDSPKVQAMIKKFGSEEAYSAFMREQQRKSRENYSGNGGFRGMTQEKRSRISSLGGKARHAKGAKTKSDTASKDKS